MEQIPVLVIGGGASGLQAAITSRQTYPDKHVVLIRRENTALIPCGIPYIFGSLGTSDKNILPDRMLVNAGVEIRIDDMTEVDIKQRVCTFKKGGKVGFEKLVLATGSKPTKPAWLKGADLKGVFTIPKNKVYLDAMVESLKPAKNVAVIGAGFIGVEVSDELAKREVNVTLIEIEPTILSKAFDSEFGEIAQQHLIERGVNVITGKGIKEILGKDGVADTLLLTDGQKLSVDAVILSMGYQPNTDYAQKAGLELNELGFIKTCEYMRVNGCTEHIFAVGDCAEKRDFVTRKLDGTMLASTACAEARIAGMNLFKLNPCKTFTGTIAIYSTAIGPHAFGTAGVTEDRANREGFNVITASFTGMDTHPGNFEHSHKQTVKLIAAKDCGAILGAEVYGGQSVGELINAVGFLIQSKTTVRTLLTMQIGTQPMLTGSPAGYPLMKAAELAAAKLRGI
jgi:NADPH-dependent 2,4-dienoyl-CoA reductase/sulfur reductase-like enzyme